MKREVGSLIQPSQEDADFPLSLVQHLSLGQCGSPVFKSDVVLLAIKQSWQNLNTFTLLMGEAL